ncbi:MAG: extracellular solute-binding protein, partial [Clostridiales bacterium]|nr:extracellular solute-binding protein [Clostridiales bacterium]
MKKSLMKAGVALLLAGCVAGTLAGCGGGSGDGELVFYHYAATNELTTQLEQKLSEFTEKTGIKVKHVPVSKDNYDATLTTKFTSKKKDMDVLYLDQPRLAQYANSNLLYKLDDYVTESSAETETVADSNAAGFKFNKNAFNSSAWATTIYQNSIYGIPLTINTSVLFYNLATVKEACGLSSDAEAVAKVNAIKTWDDLKTFAESIEGMGSTYALFGGMGSGGYMGWYSQCFIGAAGGKRYDEATKTVLPNEDGSVERAFEM